MALQSLQIAAAFHSLPPSSSEKQSHLPRNGLLSAPKNSLQARNKNTQLKITSNLSRRDAIAILSTTLLANFVPIDSAEAARIKPETRKKILEKIEKLKEKAGIPKEKTIPDSDDKGKLPPTNPPNSLSRPQVEVEADREN